MQSLPTEIKTKVCEHLLVLCDGDRIRARPSLLALRLVCQSWSLLPLSYLPQTVEASLWGPSLKRLYMISSIPNLALNIEQLDLEIDFSIAQPHASPFGSAKRRTRSSAAVPQQKKSILQILSKRKRTKSGATQLASRSSVVHAQGVNLNDLLETLEILAKEIITNNLGRTAETTDFLNALSQLSTILSECFPRLTRLKNLRIKSKSQADFMRSLQYGEALRYAPTQETWNSVSEVVISQLVLAVIVSGVRVKEFAVLGGSIRWFDAFWTSLQKRSVSRPVTELYTQFVADLTKFSIAYEPGAYQNDIASVTSYRYGVKRIVNSVILRARKLQSLSVGPINRIALAEASLTIDLAAEENMKSIKLTELDIASLGMNFDDFRHVVVDQSATLRTLELSNIHLNKGSWISLLHAFKEELKLDQFRLSGKCYSESRGCWLQTGLERPKLLTKMENFVLQKGYLDIPTLEENQNAVRIWEERISDDSMRFIVAPPPPNADG